MIPLTFLAAGDWGAAGGAMFTFVVGFGLLFLAVVWIVFPFLVNSKFNEMMRHQVATNLWLKKISEEIEAKSGSRGSHIGREEIGRAEARPSE